MTHRIATITLHKMKYSNKTRSVNRHRWKSYGL